MAVDMSKWGRVDSLKEMNKSFEDTPNGKRLRSLKLDEVVSVAQVRHTFSGLEELAESLKEVGQQSPIVVRPKNADGQYVILQGERRWRAAGIAGLKRIDAIVVDGDVELKERILGQLTENIQRDDMRPLEIAAAIKELLDSGMKAAQVAVKLGHKPSYVALYRDLLDLPEMIRQLAVQDKIKDATTLQILKKIYQARPDIAEELIRTHLDTEGGMTRAAARSLLSRCQQPEEPEKSEKKPATTRKPASPYDVMPAVEEEKEEASSESVETKKTEGEDERQTEHKSATSIRHKLPNEDEEIRPEHFEMPEVAEELPPRGRRLLPALICIKVSMLDEKADDVLYGTLVNDVLSDNAAEICVNCNGELVFWPVSRVNIETVTELKDDSLAGW